MSNCEVNNYDFFEKEVLKYFCFLEKEYDFKVTKIYKNYFTKIIRYESSKVFVNILYGPPENEVSISFGRIGIDDKSDAYCFGQGDLITLDACSKWKWESDYPNRITGSIAEFSRLLRECGSACLNSDPVVFNRMKEKRDITVSAWHRQEHASNLRKKINSAWHQKDYRAVVSLYDEIKDQLTDLEKKKLVYALRRCKEKKED